MNDLKQFSRVEKHRKRRNLRRQLLILFIFGFLIIAVLISIVVSNIKDKEKVIEDSQDEQEVSNQFEEKDSKNNMMFETNEEDVQDEGALEEEILVIEYVEPSDDNVMEAYIGNWKPIGTEQEGPHSTNFSDGSTDRIEIKRAISHVIEIEESNLVEWRIENGGDQKVIATVSDKDEVDIYRLFLSWIDHEGWQVTKVEKLKENDKR